MLDKQTQRLMQQEEKMFGISPGFKIFSPQQFAGMNQQGSARQQGDDKEFWYIENFLKTGDFCLRTLWDRGPNLYTSFGPTLIYYYFYNIGITNYVAVFFSDGTAVQVNSSTGAPVTISSVANTFYDIGLSTQIPIAASWGSTYLLIANNFSPNNYWVWDGTNLYTSGSLSPLITITDGGANYSSQPTITAYGGSGSGVTFSATLTNGSVTAVNILTPGTGYNVNDQVQLLFTGGGTDSGIELIAVLGSSQVGGVSIVSPGSGYSPGTYALGFSGGGGSAAAGTYTVSAGGTVVSTNITDGGSGYTSTPTVTFPSGGGTGASGVVSLSAGGVASVSVVNGGTNLTGTPTLIFVGGGGTGATATAVLSGGSIASVTVTAPGSNYTSVPAVVAQTGLNNAAAADLTLMPFGISGSSMENYQQHVWLGHPNSNSASVQNGGVYNVSAPGSFTDFATSDGGLQFTNSDSFLRYQYVNFKQSNGYLYAFGDSSISVISNVQTTGSPSVTTFNYQNSDLQTGVAWRDSLVPYSRTILFGNPFGVFGLYGGAVSKISKKMDNIFQNAVFPTAGGITPTSAVANIYNSKVFLMNMTITDPFTQQTRTAMVSWDESNWFVSSQTSNLTFISTQEVNSDMQAWGTDGTNLFPLFFTPSTSLSKKLSTKFYGQNNMLIQKEALGVYVQGQDLSTGQKGISINSLTVDAEHGSYDVPNIPTFPSTSGPPYFPIISMGSGDITGCNLGMTMVTSSQDMTVNFWGLGHIEVGSIAMGNTAVVGTIQTE